MDTPIVYEELVAPLVPLLREEAEELKHDKMLYKFSFFIMTLINNNSYLA